MDQDVVNYLTIFVTHSSLKKKKKELINKFNSTSHFSSFSNFIVTNFSIFNQNLTII